MLHDHKWVWIVIYASIKCSKNIFKLIIYDIYIYILLFYFIF